MTSLSSNINKTNWLILILCNENMEFSPTSSLCLASGTSDVRAFTMTSRGKKHFRIFPLPQTQGICRFDDLDEISDLPNYFPSGKWMKNNARLSFARVDGC